MSTALSTVRGTPVPAGRYLVTDPLRFTDSAALEFTDGEVVTIAHDTTVDTDGEVFVSVRGYVMASCLSPVAEPRSTPVKTARVTADVEVRYFLGGQDITDAVIAAEEVPAESEQETDAVPEQAPIHAVYHAAIISAVDRRVVVEKSGSAGTAAAWVNSYNGGVHLKAEDARAMGRHLIALADEWEAQR